MRKNLKGVVWMGAMVMALLGCGTAFAATEAPTTAMMATAEMVTEASAVDRSNLYGVYKDAGSGFAIEYMVDSSTGKDMVSVSDGYSTASYYYFIKQEGSKIYFIDELDMVLVLDCKGDYFEVTGETFFFYNGTYYKASSYNTSSEQGWIYESYYQDLGEGGISAEIGFYSDTGEDYITLEGSYYDSFGYFSGKIMYTDNGTMFAADEYGQMIYFNYNGSSITITGDYTSNGMNFPGFQGTYQKIQSIDLNNVS